MGLLEEQLSNVRSGTLVRPAIARALGLDQEPAGDKRQFAVAQLLAVQIATGFSAIAIGNTIGTTPVGILLDAPFQALVANNTITAGNVGLRIANVSNATVGGNTISGASQIGIDITDTIVGMGTGNTGAAMISACVLKPSRKC